jgi:outer membrane protein assembly factor BamB
MFKFARGSFVVLVLSLFLTGCFTQQSGKSKSEPLPKVDQQVTFKTAWKANGGSGAGKLLFNLAPALTEIDGQAAVISADHKGHVTATNAATGKGLWRVNTGLKLSSAVGFNDNLVLVGSHKAQVLALNKTTGAEVWRTTTSSEVLSGPMGNESGIAVLTNDSRLHGLNPATGKEDWLFDAAAPALKLRGGSTPLVIDTHALVGFASGQAGLFDLRTGQVVWLEAIAQPRGRTEIERIVDINGRLARRGMTAYIVTFQGKVAALDLKTLQILWTRDSSSYVGLDAGTAIVVVTDSEGMLQAFNRFTGETLWTQEALMHRQVTAPVIAKDMVIVADQKGFVYAFSLESGRLLGYRRVDTSGISAPPLVDNQDVIVQSKAGRLIKLELVVE